MDQHMVQMGLREIIEEMNGQREALGTVRFFELLAGKLAGAIGRTEPWSWRYPQGVVKGTIQPSKDFGRAVMALGAAIDGTPAALADVVRVDTYAPPGRVQPGAVILGTSRVCANPGCKVVFVPNVPWRKYCGRCR